MVDTKAAPSLRNSSQHGWLCKKSYNLGVLCMPLSNSIAPLPMEIFIPYITWGRYLVNFVNFRDFLRVVNCLLLNLKKPTFRTEMFWYRVYCYTIVLKNGLMANFCHLFLTTIKVLACRWCTTLVPVLKRRRQADLWNWGHPGLHSESQVRQRDT